jgi:hypothetical protein
MNKPFMLFNNLILICAFSLIQFSCSSSQKSAVPCPDFSHSRNMKSRHARLENTYPDQKEECLSGSTWAQHSWFKGPLRFSEVKNPVVNRYPASGFVQTNKDLNIEKIFSIDMLPGRFQLSSMVIPIERVQPRRPVSMVDKSESGKPLEAILQGCDTVVFRNGDIMPAKVIEIGQREIRYRRCGDTEGPVFVANITDIFMIKYPNGTRDYFTSGRNPAPSMGNTIPKQTDGMAVGGFICSLAGLFIAGIPLGIMAMIFGSVSLGRIKSHPERYKGRGFAIASVIIGFVDVIGMLIILATM